jgi:methylenetetrahydrofolate reductase (NADPH)
VEISGNAQILSTLAREASIELNVQDLNDLEASRALLPRGKRVYISHLPKQRWNETLIACQRVIAAGFDPIPHIPVRLIESEALLDDILERAANARVKELLLIAGDYAQVAGPYSAVADVLRANKLQQYGFTRVSFAGHPEGHPKVPREQIREAEVEKAALTQALETTFVTQFFFEASPFLQWASEARARGIGRARLIAGLAGPAGIATLLKFAKRCGVGPSIRALMTRPRAFSKLIGELGPEEVMQSLASAYAQDASTFSGLHFFCFGGYLRTCEWLDDLVGGRVQL